MTNEELEAKLAKAIEVLERIASMQPRSRRDGSYDGHDISNLQRAARNTLTELKGEQK